ncbi:unnamed protein product [Microthlaspi erraticum]|uniref:Uncharacterized protein n=1 Tax=Microthlaspi erraticum TaxID=1685480 RepID=A0A6D2JTU1_9BRAS|nr:unnamed protein product [Microthlaspi erraticum]
MTKQRIVLKRNTEVGVSELFNGFIPLDLVPFQDVKNGTVHDGTSYTRDFLGVISSVSDFGLTVDDSMPRNIHNYDPKTPDRLTLFLKTTSPIQVEDEEGISTFEYDPPGHHEVVHFTNILLHHEEDLSDE